jgi:hypothetical protein
MLGRQERVQSQQTGIAIARQVSENANREGLIAEVIEAMH